MIRFKTMLCIIAVGLFLPLWAQAPYGVGDNINVPYVAPGTLTMDGNDNEAAWQNAVAVDIMAYWEGSWSGHPVPDISAESKLLWTEDTIFVWVKIEDYQYLFFGPDTVPYGGEQILVGIDRQLIGDPPGDMYDPSWAGAPWNAPDQGPTVYKISDLGITCDWGWAGITPTDSGWVAGTVFIDQTNFIWGVEMKIWAPRIRTNSMVGFNVAGATADSSYNPGSAEKAYAYFCWHPQPTDTLQGYPTEFYAGDLQRRAQSFGTLTFVGGPTAYGVNDEIIVPYVAPDALNLDGDDNEAAWQDAAEVDIMAYWEGSWSGHPVPDVDATAKLLWTDDTLFTYVRIEDYQYLYFGADTVPYGGEQILLGVDGPMYGDPPGDMYDASWAGAPWNAPAQGPTVYKISDLGITCDWGWAGITPADSGWVAGTVFIDQTNFIWGVEMKAYLPQVALGTRTGFNIAGATADSSYNPGSGEKAYAYFCWHPQPTDTLQGYPTEFYAGDLQRRAQSFGTLRFEMTTDIKDRPLGENEVLPNDYILQQNYPNPFNPSTNIQFSIHKAAQVKLEVFNIVGQKIATLYEGQRAAGSYVVSWDSKDVASGVYFYRLSVDDQAVAARKALLMK